MTSYELAIDEEGEPFGVPPEVKGWRVRRAQDGRGRPSLVHGRGKAKGKPLIVPVDASHADLLVAAGPGKYRLEAVDAAHHKIDGIPAACTGPLNAEDGSDDSDEMPEATETRPDLEAVLCQVVAANTRMVERALGQMGTVMTGVAELLNAAHNAGITSRPPPIPPPPPPPVESFDDEDDDDNEAEPNGQAAPSRIPEVLQYIIDQAISTAVPLIFQKLGAAGGTIAGIPLEALADWRKAAPSAPAASPPPPPAAPNVPPPPPSTPPTATTPAPAYVAPTAAPAAAGAAPSVETPPGAAPASMAPASNSPTTPKDAEALLNAHVIQVWQGLTDPERARAAQLISRLTAEERTAWIGELARQSVPEAIARARAVLQGPPPTNPQLLTATSKDKPS
jgi:hypothetical protein